MNIKFDVDFYGDEPTADADVHELGLHLYVSGDWDVGFEEWEVLDAQVGTYDVLLLNLENLELPVSRVPGLADALRLAAESRP